MTEPKDMTDAELVEAVAREVLGCSVTGDWGTSGKIICKTPPIGIQFDPFTDMNDLFIVPEKFDSWGIHKEGTKSYMACLYWNNNEGVSIGYGDTINRAVLEAALMAERGK